MLDRIFQITLVVVVLFLLLIVSFAVYILGFNPDLSAPARDVAVSITSALIVLATAVALVLLLAILYAIALLTRVVQRDLLPKVQELTTKVDVVLGNAQTASDRALETVTSVSATTSFTAEKVAAPLIRVTSMLTGVRAAVGAFARRDAPSPSADFRDLTTPDGTFKITPPADGQQTPQAQ